MIRNTLRRLQPNPLGGGDRDQGDTLVEILVTITILGFAVVGLLGALLTSTSASVTHRNETTLDTVLRNFIDDARYMIQTQPFTGTPGANPQFQPCAANAAVYYVASAPYPSSAAAGSTVTVFSIGSSTADTIALIGNTALGQTANTPLPGSTLNPATNVWTVPIPSGGSAPAPSTVPYSLVFTHAGVPYKAAGGLTVLGGSASPTSSARQFANYSLTASLSRWDSGSNAFLTSTDCIHTPLPFLQRLTIQVVSTEPGSGASQSDSILLSNLAPATTPTLSIPDDTVNLGQSVTLTATITGATGTPSNTGSFNTSDTVTWSNLPNGQSCTGGNTTFVSGAWQSTCALGPVPAGTYTPSTSTAPTATYKPAPASTNAAAVGKDTVIVHQGTVTSFHTTSSPSSSPQPLGTPITFTATITGSAAAFPPSGTVTWSNLPAGVSCAGGSNTTPINSGQANCLLNSQLTASPYNPTAVYNGDNNYPSGASDHSATLTESAGTPAITFPNPPGKVQLDLSLLFTVNVGFPADAVAPTGSVTWTINGSDGSHPPCTRAGPTTATGQSTYTCSVAALILNPLVQYSATFSIGSDNNYASAGPLTSSQVPG